MWRGNLEPIIVSVPTLFLLVVANIALAQDDPENDTAVVPDHCEPLDLAALGGGLLELCDDNPAYETILGGGTIEGSWEAPSDGAEGYQLAGELSGLSLNELTGDLDPGWSGQLSGSYVFLYDDGLELISGTIEWIVERLVAEPYTFELGLGLALAIITPTDLGRLSGRAEMSDGMISLTELVATGGDDIELSIDSGGRIRIGDGDWQDGELDLILRATLSAEWVANNSLGPILENVFIFAESCHDNLCEMQLQGPLNRLLMSPATSP